LAISPAGDWLAFACAGSAQLLVWEWQSETYILKQQGHRHNLSHIAYSPDGQAIATGSDDGKLKLWNTQSGFCYVTFTDHSAGITACEFIGKQGGKQGVVFTASLDGTVRAFDLIRYRCFRTFTAPHPCQFVSLAIDASGELVCAGSMDTYEIFIWSVQTGQLLDVLAGHEGPVTSLAFSPEGTVAASSATSATLLISGSWDKTVRVWDVYSRGNGSKCMETFRHQHDVMAVAFRPDGKEIAAATLDGLISFWDPYEGTHAARISEIEGRRDIAGGRKATDRRSARNTSNDKYFTSLAYTADGNGLLAGGNSKWVCFYDLPSQVLLRKEQICKNLAFDGLQERLSSKRMTEAGPLDLMDVDEELSDVEDRVAARQYLPGVQKGDLSERKVRPEIRTKCLRFNPTGRSWAAATTEGLVIYSLDDTVVFDPFDLEMDLTPDAIRRMVLQAKTDTGQNDWLEALVMSLRLNEAGLIQYVYESIPPGSLELVAQGLPRLYLDRMLAIIAALFESSSKPTLESNASTLHRSPHLEFHLVFLSHLLRIHGRYLREHCRSRGSIHIQAGKGKSSNLVISSMPIILRAVKKSVTMLREDLSQVCDNNLHVLEFLRLSGHLKESIKMDE
jgi:periodic tryptophan protein 2